MAKRVVIVGASKTGQRLAQKLCERTSVVLVDQKAEPLTIHGEIQEPGQVAQPKTPETGVVPVQADGTSRLVLERLFDAEIGCSLVATIDDDEFNFEVSRLARAIGYDPVIALAHSFDKENFEAQRIATIDKPQLLSERILGLLRHHGAVMPSGIGLGKGELLEIRLVRTSPVLGRPLHNLAPHHWRVAAVFRGDQLIVPTGETVLAEDDRVLLVGDPEVLSTVADSLRRGVPQFPRPYGPNVLTLETDSADQTLYNEANHLRQTCQATQLVRGIAGAQDSVPAEDKYTDCIALPHDSQCVEERTFDLPALDAPDLSSKLARQRPGLVVTKPSQRSLMSRILGLGGHDAVLCDLVDAPVLFSRATFPYKKILLPVSDSPLNIHSCEVAIDITRQMGASLTAVNVDLPRYISGLDEEAIHREVVPIRRLCQLYDVPLEYRHFEGNPIEHLLAESQHHHLMVLVRSHQRTDNYFNPDVALRLARRAQCSVLVLTVRNED